MKKLLIQQKLESMGYSLDNIMLGDFDAIGEFTAKKNRDRSSPLYRKAGCFFRPNYERGILMYHLVKKYNFKSILEIGFGRGYATLCMAKAMCDLNIDGTIKTVDPYFNNEHLKSLYSIFPGKFFEKIELVNTTSEKFYELNPDDKFDFIYIDGDHRYEAVEKDWNYASQSAQKFVLFDDYCEREQKDIECSTLINKIEDYEKELILMDRRIFFDDRRIKDEDIDYGQVLVDMRKKS